MSELPLRFHRAQCALILLGYGLFFFWTVPAVPELATHLSRAYELREAWWGVFCACGWLSSALTLGVVLRTLSDRPRRARAVLSFVILPLWGLILNAQLPGECQRAFPAFEYRLLAIPEVYGLLVLHVVTAGGYAISRRRPEVLPARVEPWVVALLITGLLSNLALAIQLLGTLPLLLFFPLTLPLITPFVLIALFWRELTRRLRESAERAQTPVMLGPALLRAPLVIGVHVLLQGLWLGRPSAALDVFARTCTQPLSTLPLQIADTTGGHYLCTIAALGHPALVRPERLGRRRGEVILVNRQLAIANAFEDLLHARWPRFGYAARVCYDRLALPICCWIKSRWLADLLYLAMKPAEWLFYFALLLFDQESPEARIDRMYR